MPGETSVRHKSSFQRTRSVRLILSATVLSTAALISLSVLVASAAPGDTIVVCPAGPPTCDTESIQAGIDAASAGDRVLVHAGAYTEQVTLKSGVVLASRAGPTATTIAAAEGPSLVANGATSASVRGFTISILTPMNPTVGVDILDSDVSIADCVVRDIQGADGSSSESDGDPAIGVRFGGAGSLTLSSVTIRDIRGGDGLEDTSGGGKGGDALGVEIDASGAVVISRTTISRLTGGAAGTYAGWPYSCQGQGGRTTGILAGGGTDILVSHSELENFTGGRPCVPAASYCSQRPGPVRGIQAEGGTVVLRDNRISDLSAWAGHGGEPNHAVHTSGTAGTIVERNSIISLSARLPSSMDETLEGFSPQSPYCAPPPGTMVGIGSDGDTQLRVTENAVDTLSAAGTGQALGIQVNSTEEGTVARNSVRRIGGGSRPAVGIDVGSAQAVDVDANVTGDIHGEDGEVYYYFPGAVTDAGVSLGINLSSVGWATVTNNVVWSLVAGRGADDASPPSDGGDAAALKVSDTTFSAHNNTFYRTVGGPGGEPDGLPGIGVGIQLAEGADGRATNNAVVRHGVGISTSATASSALDHNDLWDNETDYVGVSPGVHDLSVNPSFVDPDEGDFHLTGRSPLIDAGHGLGETDYDLEHEPRRVDGDDDGTATIDIGADEYWPDLRGSSKQVTPTVGRSGDLLSYELTLVNPSSLYDRVGVMVTDTLTAPLTYSDETLRASDGRCGYANGVITWTGTVSAGQAVSVTFDATVASEFAGSKMVVNRAILDDRIGAKRTLEAGVLVNPLKAYLPVLVRRCPCSLP